MLEFESKVKKWGNSFGVIIPKGELKEKTLKENDVIVVIAMKKSDAVKESFGLLKNWKTPTQKLKDNLRKDLYAR